MLLPQCYYPSASTLVLLPQCYYPSATRDVRTKGNGLQPTRIFAASTASTTAGSTLLVLLLVALPVPLLAALPVPLLAALRVPLLVPLLVTLLVLLLVPPLVLLLQPTHILRSRFSSKKAKTDKKDKDGKAEAEIKLPEFMCRSFYLHKKAQLKVPLPRWVVQLKGCPSTIPVLP